MNTPEFACLAGLLVVLFFYFALSRYGKRPSLILTLAVAPALFLALDSTSQFLTVDEIYIIRETADLDFHYVNQWYMGSNRTNDAFLGGLSRMVRALFTINDIHLRMLLKLAHFAAGFLVLLLIHAVASPWAGAAARSPLFALLFFYSMLLLPVSAFAFKIFNYDLFSMSLSVCGLVLMASAFHRRKPRRALLGVVAAYLAAQEKIPASPVLLLCCALYGVFHACRTERFAYAKLLLFDLRAVLVALGTGFFCVVLVGLAGEGFFPKSFIGRTGDPFVAFVGPLVRFVTGAKSFGGEFSYPLMAKKLIVALAAVYSLSALLFLLRSLPDRLSWFGPALHHGALLLAAAAFAAGTAATFIVRQHICPFTEGTAFPFAHTQPFNGFIIHYGASSAAAHLFLSIGYAYATFVNAVPTALWIMIAAAFLLERRRAGAPPLPWYFDAALAGIFIIPFAWGAAQIPLANRYFNIFLMLFALIACVKWSHAFAPLPKMTRALAAAAAVLFLAAEVWPFGPLYCAFRPFWSTFPDREVPQRSLGNPSWVGWGEEVMLAGRKIEKIERERRKRGGDGPRITLYTLYAGDYLTASGTLPFDLKFVRKEPRFAHIDVEQELGRAGKTCAKAQVVYDSTTLFLVNRHDFIVAPIEFPRGIDPLFILRWRGYPNAWVWRGDELKRAGFSF